MRLESATGDIEFDPIIKPDDATKFFRTWRAAISAVHGCDEREESWLELAAVAGRRVRAKEMGAAFVADELRQIIREQSLFPDKSEDEIQMLFAAAFEGKARATLNGHAMIDEAPPPLSEADYGEMQETTPEPILPAVFITPANWPNEAPPPVDWLAEQRIPRGDVTTLHGDGGAGKTDSGLQLAANIARRSPYWFGHAIERGAVVVISAEEPEREVRRRVWLHGQRDGYDAESLTDLHLWFPDDVAGAVLAVADRSGIMHPTPLLRSLTAGIEAIAPALVLVDNVAATFAGNQNDRVMVRSYVNLWRAIARGPSRPAVLLLDHPSLSGLTNGTGRGGNMDWRNAVRSALYLRSPDDKSEADRGVRILETVKSNYGPTGNPIRLQWAEGGLALEHAPSSLHRQAKDAECDETFLRLLDERNAQGRHVGDRPSAIYAPKVFAGMDGNGGFTVQPFAGAMDRLFASGSITLAQDGPPSKRRNRIVRAAPHAYQKAAE